MVLHVQQNTLSPFRVYVAGLHSPAPLGLFFNGENHFSMQESLCVFVYWITFVECERKFKRNIPSR